jgi:phosphatidylserine decarboxylase
MRVRIVCNQLVPAFIIVGALWFTVAFRQTHSGVDVHVSSVRSLEGVPISVTKVGRRETLGTKRVGERGAARFDLEPGRYEITVPVGSAVARRRVFVRDERYVRVNIVAPDGAS